MIAQNEDRERIFFKRAAIASFLLFACSGLAEHYYGRIDSIAVAIGSIYAALSIKLYLIVSRRLLVNHPKAILLFLVLLFKLPLLAALLSLAVKYRGTDCLLALAGGAVLAPSLAILPLLLQ